VVSREPRHTIGGRLARNESSFVAYEGAPHRLLTTHKDKLNADLLAFLKS
jgi:non-heme chloroperoxidase